MLRRALPRRHRVLLALAVAAAPWSWFLLRDALGPVGDVIAILAPILVAAIVVALLVQVLRRRERRWLIPAVVSMLLWGTVVVLAPWTPQPTGPVAAGQAVRIAAANVTGLETTAQALLDTSADVLVVSENKPGLDERLAAGYRYHLYGDEQTSGVGVYSRFPLRSLDAAGLDGQRVAVAAPTPFVLYAMHVPRPWIDDNGYQASVPEHHSDVVELARRAAAEPGPVVVAGDLNTTDRSRDYRLLTGGLVDVMRETWAGRTSVTTWRLLLLRIDHVLVGHGWCGDAPARFALPGSDHQGISVTVGPCVR